MELATEAGEAMMRLNVGTPRDGLALDEARLERLKVGAETTDDPVLLRVLEALSAPSFEVFVDATGPAGQRRVVFSVTDDIAAVLMSRSGQSLELAAITPDSIPAVIARTAGLAPGAAEGDTVVRVPVKDLEALAEAPYPVSEKLSRLDVAAALESGDWRMTMVQIVPHRDGSNGDRFGFEVVGAAGRGWWFLERGARKVQIIPTRAAMVWGLITDLLAEAIDPAEAFER